MKICAITMVYKDYWALAQWTRHYSKHLGIENLYVVAHGSDDKINEIAAGANIWTIPRGTLKSFDRRRYRMLNQFQGGLLEFYDWVIRTDTDELICVDPILHGSFEGLLTKIKEDAVFAIGLNIFEHGQDIEMPDGTPVFQERSAAVITGNYSKAWAVSTGTSLMRHGVRLVHGEEKYRYAFPKGVYLAHLKFANIQALASANLTRKEVARSEAHGVPGLGWRKADSHAMKFFGKFEETEQIPWEDAIALAHETIPTQMKFDESDGIIKSPGIPFLVRTTLPDWFKTY